jgi:hypothetical protein
MTRKAACSCGQLSVVVKGEPVRTSIWHCLDCQRRTGSVFAAQAWFPRNPVTVGGRAAEYRRIADRGNRITFFFCPSCASTVTYEAEVLSDRIAVPIGAFADPAFPAPRVSVYESRKHSWVEVPADFEEFDQEQNAELLVPRDQTRVIRDIHLLTSDL